MAEQETPQFTPGTQYKWTPDTQIILTGQEFSLLYNNVSQFVNGFQSISDIMRVVDCFAVLQDKLNAMVANGVAVPVEATPTEAMTGAQEGAKA